MAIEKQFSIFVQNKAGSLKDLCATLAEEKINIRAISVADDMDWGIVRLITNDPDRTKIILHKLGLMFGESRILTFEAINHPGALAELTAKLCEQKINIEHAFATACGHKTILVLNTTNDEQANEILETIYEVQH